VGWPDFDDFSKIHSFKTFSDSSNFPLSIGLMGDLGTSFNATQTVDQVLRSQPQIVINVGDLAYAGVYGVCVCVVVG